MHPLRNAALLGGLALLGLPVANAAELIISEYVEGSGNNKALEFYNSGSQVLDLSAYRVEIYFNGASAAGRSIDLSGSLAPGKTFVLANGVADPALLALASQRVEGSWFNGNDAVLLRRRSGEILDSLGQVGFNPGTTWAAAMCRPSTGAWCARPTSATATAIPATPSTRRRNGWATRATPSPTSASMALVSPAAARRPACDRSTRCRAPAPKVRW